MKIRVIDIADATGRETAGELVTAKKKKKKRE